MNAIKRLFFLFDLAVVVILLLGCNGIDTSGEVWKAVKDKEFSNYASEIGAGTGLYFYEKESAKHCLYMIYGSGLYVTGWVDYEICLGENGNFSVLSALEFESDHYSDPGLGENFVFRYTSNGIQFGGDFFEETSIGMHDYVLEIIDQTTKD